MNMFLKYLTIPWLSIILIVILNTWTEVDPFKSVYISYFKEDLDFCPTCFQEQMENCLTFFKDVNTTQFASVLHLMAFVPRKICKRYNNLIEMRRNNRNTKVMAKYLGQRKESLLRVGEWSEKELESYYIQQKSLDGMQLYPKESIGHFVKDIHAYSLHMPEITIWIYMLTNVQPAIMPILYDNNFPVPKTYACCGFSLFQEYAGQNLNNFYKSSFIVKLQIAKLLLELALKFSYGLKNYRFYITDLTADNLAYNPIANTLTLVDLDTLLVVDAMLVKYKSEIHSHEYLDCPGCFAYSPDEISSYNLSDINIYSACQLLRQDLYNDESKGFLYPIPTDLTDNHRTEILELLNQCVDCPSENCTQRFEVAANFIKFIAQIISLFA